MSNANEKQGERGGLVHQDRKGEQGGKIPGKPTTQSPQDTDALPAAVDDKRLSALAGWIDERREEVWSEAQALEARVMTTLHDARRIRKAGGYAKLGVRVRRGAGGSRNTTVSIEWYKVRGTKRTDYIARGAAPRYDRRAFRSCTAWERAVAFAAEELFGAMRERQQRLRKLETLLLELSRAPGDQQVIDALDKACLQALGSEDPA